MHAMHTPCTPCTRHARHAHAMQAMYAPCTRTMHTMHAMHAMHAMQAAVPPVFPNLACYRGAVEACAEAAEWEAALAVWQGMQSGVLRQEMAADTATYAALLRVLVGAGRRQEARPWRRWRWWWW